MPLCMKVESPMTATIFLAASGRTFSKPWRTPMDAPMQMVESMADRGAEAPRV